MGSGPVKGFGITLVIGLLATFLRRVSDPMIFDWLVAKAG